MTASETGPEPVQVADIPGRSMLILYGSETGNSQDIAEELGRSAQRLHFKTKVDEMNGAQLSMLLQYSLIVFVISTTGQGDMPRNSAAFWRSLLRKKLPPGCLGTVKFTTFGLGDSMYIKFNWAARKLHKRLEQLGAVEFYPRGEADEQDSDGFDERYLPWAADLSKKLLDLCPLPEGVSPIPNDALLPPRYHVALAEDTDARPPSTQHQDEHLQSMTNGYAAGLQSQAAQSGDVVREGVGSPALVEDLVQKTSSVTITDDTSKPIEDVTPSRATTEANQPPTTLLPIPGAQDASLELNRRVTPPTHFQDVRHVRLTLKPTPNGAPSINPFDSLTVYPKNFPQDVQKLIDLMQWNAIADHPLSFSPFGANPDLPRGLHIDPRGTTTLRDLLTHNLDITSIPRRSFLKEMSYFSDDDYHKQRLLEFTMREYTDEFFDYTTRPRRTILEVLDEFTSVRIPLGRVLDMFPVMRGRDFSIASTSPSPTEPQATTVTLLIALVKYKTVLRKIRQGLCSRYLESLPLGTPLRITLNRSTAPLHGPLNARRPLCAVATGTGVAPLRLFVEERLSHPAAGDTVIFFGNRSRHADFHFKDVWDAIKARATSGQFDVHTAFSRDADAPREYVQDVIRKHPARIRAMVAADAIFVVCGGSLKMSRAVKEAVRDCLRGDAETYPDEAAVEAAFTRLTWWEEIW
ncbi:NADPH-dependent diflavin oxidoreductase 1 [Colletotrichum chlorophyti]|uniref:NADPH-dependent diflavin oxidoreductase 1 n=1 Tax=Colletotrichum chlorophyti TaxID=708187 RepID=A0A1Q8RU93_9PEZI|nr:NADPH-dependent diflavin oxidoreductase 1 [Colletotrichum chlorophyti]